ncbi:unnamed protein product [Sympodiomycopsis kandeliae]
MTSSRGGESVLSLKDDKTMRIARNPLSTPATYGTHQEAMDDLSDTFLPESPWREALEFDEHRSNFDPTSRLHPLGSKQVDFLERSLCRPTKEEDRHTSTWISNTKEFLPHELDLLDQLRDRSPLPQRAGPSRHRSRSPQRAGLSRRRSQSPRRAGPSRRSQAPRRAGASRRERSPPRAGPSRRSQAPPRAGPSRRADEGLHRLRTGKGMATSISTGRTRETRKNSRKPLVSAAIATRKPDAERAIGCVSKNHTDKT